MQRAWHVILALVVSSGFAAADPGSGSGKGSGSGSGNVRVRIDNPKTTTTPTTDPSKPVDPDAPVEWDPVRWQAPDGTTVTFELAARRGEMPKLRVRSGEASYELALKNSFKQMVPTFLTIDDDVVITTSATPGVAWRFAWKKGKIAQTKTAYWATAKAMPAWAAEPPATTATAVLRRIAGLLRFGGTVPGLDRFFGESQLTWDVYTRGDKKPWKRTMAAREALARWSGAGYPIVRGKLTIAKSCMTLPANVEKKPAAPAAPPDAPNLLKVCLGTDLAVASIETLIAPQPEGTKPSAVMPAP